MFQKDLSLCADFLSRHPGIQIEYDPRVTFRSNESRTKMSGSASL
ncbi:hypothetical protein Pan241w_29750 [Gimesia alba]|uniref:Uncharacterized protein n=1 Tax=Gimesia alba TaxID=2527973 RepID=A0A517RG86_9PLAN|nr:hypothetical protein Pan241w_29750 [Gimesia alba]